MQSVHDELAHISESLSILSIQVVSVQQRIPIQIPADPQPAEGSLDHERENEQNHRLHQTQEILRDVLRDYSTRRSLEDSTLSTMAGIFAEGTPPVAEHRSLTPPAEELEGQPPIPVYEVSVHSPSESADSARFWIHSRKPPLSARGFRRGPFSWTQLQKCLQLNDETMETLDCLCLAPDQSLRVHLYQDFAFLHDPIYIEEHIDGISRATYLIDWGSQELNDRISDGIKQHPRDALHTFVFPRQRARWAYIGIHSWAIAELWEVWQGLSRKSRVAIVTHLAGRSVDPPERIMEDIESGKMAQICIRIEIQSIEESEAFYEGLNHKKRRNRGEEAA